MLLLVPIHERGLRGTEFTTQGFGATRFVAANAKPDGSDDPAGRQKNRRVEIIASHSPRPSVFSRCSAAAVFGTSWAKETCDRADGSSGWTCLRCRPCVAGIVSETYAGQSSR